MPKPRQHVSVPCTTCTTVVELTPQQLPYWRKTGRAFCSHACGVESRRRAGTYSGPSEAGRAALAARMTAANPMSDPAVRAKMSASLRARGHRPPVRGGNGRGMTEPQRLLAEALGSGWEAEYVIPTRAGRRGGLPTHYKVDIAHPTMLIAVEVDGQSHYSRRAEDDRKTEFLAGLGWTVLRFSNRDVMADTADCARTVWSTTSRLKARTPTG